MPSCHPLRLAPLCLCILAASSPSVPAAGEREPVPGKVVVLTFDDAVRSHFTVVRPLLLERGFSATFFVSEGFTFPTDKGSYMTWKQIRALHEAGFEIGNHTRDHMDLRPENLDRLAEQLAAIDEKCLANGIPKPVSFAYPGNAIELGALPILAAAGIRFARRGGSPEHPYADGRGVAYQPGLDHPLLVPSAGDARPDWKLEDFVRALDTASAGGIPVLQLHGVPDEQHPWVSTRPHVFRQLLDHLVAEGYSVLALRDLERYVDPDELPADPLAVIRARLAARQGGGRGR